MRGTSVYKEVVALLRPERWAATRSRLEDFPVAYTERRVLGRGRERGLQYLPRQGARPAGIRCLPYRMISWEVPASLVDSVVQAILEANCTGQAGDGRIFVLPMEAVAAEATLPVAAWEVLTQPASEVVHAPGQ